MTVIMRSGYVKARKDYRTDISCYFDFARYPKEGIRISELKEIGMTDDEVAIVLEGDKTQFKILKGEIHYSQTGTEDGELYTFRAPTSIHQILLKYDMYEEY